MVEGVLQSKVGMRKVSSEIWTSHEQCVMYNANPWKVASDFLFVLRRCYR